MLKLMSISVELVVAFGTVKSSIKTISSGEKTAALSTSIIGSDTVSFVI